MNKVKILNFGSLNIDHVYNVDGFVRAGETIQSNEYQKFSGGKGLNQSIALARAGANVLHAGKIGVDGMFLLDLLKTENVDSQLIEISENHSTGHAMIQVNSEGQNCIVLYGGTNLMITQEQIEKSLNLMEKGDYLVLQNEINLIEDIIKIANKKELKIFINPAPMTKECLNYSLNLVDTIILNECEASYLCDLDSKDYHKFIEILSNKYPHPNILITLGADGAAYYDKNDKDIIYIEAAKVEKVVDTTAAGDTFIGYFIASLSENCSYKKALEIATKASGITISKLGATTSIPFKDDLI